MAVCWRETEQHDSTIFVFCHLHDEPGSSAHVAWQVPPHTTPTQADKYSIAVIAKPLEERLHFGDGQGGGFEYQVWLSCAFDALLR